MRVPEPVQQLGGGLGLFAMTVATGWPSHWLVGVLVGVALYIAHESGQHGLDGMLKPRLDMVRLLGVAVGGVVCALWL